MGVKASVFASKSERANYYKLARVWSHKLKIVHNLPFLSVLTPTNLHSFWAHDAKDIRPFAVTRQEMNWLKKTSIDYTLCDEQDKPLLCIEFDGLQEGFNVRTDYHSRSARDLAPDPWRQEIMDLKLKIAFGSVFPFFIVGSSEFADLSSDVELTIVDGIIGEVLKSKAMAERFAQGFDPEDSGLSQEQFDLFSADEQHETVQDWALGVETEAEMTHNPITRKAWDLTRELDLRAYSRQYVDSPNVANAQSIEERIRLLDTETFVTCKHTFQTEDLGDVSITVRLPNFQSVGMSVYGLLPELTMLLAALKVKKLRELHTAAS